MTEPVMLLSLEQKENNSQNKVENTLFNLILTLLIVKKCEAFTRAETNGREDWAEI